MDLIVEVKEEAKEDFTGAHEGWIHPTNLMVQVKEEAKKDVKIKLVTGVAQSGSGLDRNKLEAQARTLSRVQLISIGQLLRPRHEPSPLISHRRKSSRTVGKRSPGTNPCSCCLVCLFPQKLGN
jgi:hypothetical protein